MRSLRLYPTTAAARRRTILRDLAVVLGVVVFAWAGVKVHDAVAELAGLGRGLQDAGGAVTSSTRSVGGALRDGFGGAGDAVGGAPLVGGTLRDALRNAGSDIGGTVEDAGEDSGGRVVAAGRDGERRAYRLANLLGWLTFGLPTLYLLARTLPARIRMARGWTAAQRTFAPRTGRAGATATDARGAVIPPPPGAPEAVAPGDRRRVLAERAMATLPYADLLRHSADPVGDLLAGRHDGLLAALADAEGVDARRVLAA